MASNAELIESITALAEELGKNVETDGLKNAELAELLSALRSEAKDPTAGARDAAEAKAKAEADRIEAANKKTGRFFVAERKALTTKRGILSGDNGDEVRPEDLPGGREAFDAFVKSGHIVKR